MEALASPPDDKTLLWHELRSQELAQKARSSMLAFTRYMNPYYRINWHHRVIAHHLDLFMQRKITRLMIFEEPQSGKSELVSRNLPAMQFGLDPHHRWISASYNEDLASGFNADVQKIIDSDRYRSVFPETRLAQPGERGAARNSSRLDIVGYTGQYHSIGVGGSGTGKTAHTFCIDDPVKSEKEARSVTYREEQWRWFKSVARTRLKVDRFGREPAILLTMTRWHHDDLAARIQAELKAHPELMPWTILTFPAIREDMSDPLDPRKLGEPLWAQNRSLAQYRELQADSVTWNALFMQRPSTSQGTVVQRKWWRFYKQLPEKFDKVIQSWDLTFDETEKGSFVVGQVWGKLGPDRYLIHQYRQRIGFTDQVEQFLAVTKNYPHSRTKLVEKKANGAALINTLKKKVSGIEPIEPRGSKENRAESVAPIIKSGNVYLPDPDIASWVTDFLDEWSEFPKSKNNDQVDATSQALDHFEDAIPTDFVIGSITGQSKWK